MAVTEYLLGKKEIISFSDTEGTYGSVAARVEKLGRDATFDPNLNSQNLTEVRGAATDSLDIGVREFGQEDWGGVLTFTPQNWKFLKFVLLSDSDQVTDTGSAPSTHTFTNSTTGLVSFSLERAIQGSTDRVRTYEGCQVDNFSLNWDGSGVGNFLTATANISAEDCNNGTSTTSLTAPTTEGYKPRHVLLTLEGNAVATMRSGTITIANSLSDGRYANQAVARLKGESIPTVRRCTLTGVVETQDDTFFDMLDSADVLGSTNKLELIRGANDKLTVTFTNAYLNKAIDPTNLDGINSATLDLQINTCAFVAVDALEDYETFT